MAYRLPALIGDPFRSHVPSSVMVCDTVNSWLLREQVPEEEHHLVEDEIRWLVNNH